MKKVQLGTELVIPSKENNATTILKYYMTESPVGFGYSELKSYGVEILKTERVPGLKDMNECKQIQGIFFDIEEAVSFISKIRKDAVIPTKLSKTLENYILCKVKKHRSVYKCQAK